MKSQLNSRQSVSKIPPHNLIRYPISKQTPIFNLLFDKFLKKYGLSQVVTYKKNRKRNPKSTFPYMPSLPESSDDIYLYDFHSHTNFSDGQGTHEEILIDISQKKHLTGIAFTDHPWHKYKEKDIRIPNEKAISQSFKGHEIALELKRKGRLPEEFITFPGSCEFFVKIEENSKEADIELIALGVPKGFIENNGGLRRLTHRTAVEFIELVHDNNGLVIVPHPFYFNQSYQLLKSRKSSRNSRPDGMEAINYTIGLLSNEFYYEFLEQFSFSRELKLIGEKLGYLNWMATIISQQNDYGKYFDYPIARDIAPLGSSDAHFKSMVGAACTVLKDPVHSIEDLREVFKKRTTLPVFNSLWDEQANKAEVYKEIWEGYGDTINESINKINASSHFKLMLTKIIIDLLF